MLVKLPAVKVELDAILRPKRKGAKKAVRFYNEGVNYSMENFSISVKGIVSRTAKRKLLSKLRYTNTDPNCCMLFFDKAEFDIPAGTTFSFLVDPGPPQQSFPIKATIKMVTQAQGLLLEEIPKGMRTICDVCFDAASFKLVNEKVAVAETPYERPDIVYTMSGVIK